MRWLIEQRCVPAPLLQVLDSSTPGCAASNLANLLTEPICSIC